MVEKTKTQALGGFFQKLKKLKKKNSKLNVFQGEDTHFVIFIAKYVQKQDFSYKKNQNFHNLSKCF